MHLWLQSNSFEVSCKSFEKTITIWYTKLIAKNLPIYFYAYSRFPNKRGVPNKSIGVI